MWRKIADDYLKVQPGERFVVIADMPVELPISAELILAPSTGGHGREPHPDVWRAVFGAAAISALEMQGIFDRVLAKTLDDTDRPRLEKWADNARKMVPGAAFVITHFSTSHTAFRRLLNRAGTRYASMPHFQPELLRKGGALDVDFPAMVERTRRTALRLGTARQIRVVTPIGTDLRFSVEGRRFEPDDGDLSAPGSFGNLPAGEVYAAPLEGSGHGVLALAEDVVLVVEDGKVIRIEGGGAHPVRKVFAEHPEYLYLAELGIGTNDKASIVANVLEAEKILGTVHIAFGDNSSFGGKQQIPYHEDHVLFEPTLYVDGQVFPLPAA